MAVKILIDSASDIDKTEAKELGISMISMEVRFGDDVYLDGDTLLAGEFYTKLVENKDYPQTSLINEYRWQEQFRELTSEGDELLVLTLSSKLSGTYHEASEAAKKYKGKVFVVDTLSAVAGERLLLQLAMRRIQEGKTAEEIKAELDERKLNLKIFAMIDTLKYLKKGGRISATTAFFGEALNMKPIVKVEDGEVKMHDKARGLKKATELLNRTIENLGGIDLDLPYALVYSGNDTTNLEKYMKDSDYLWKDGKQEMKPYILGSTIGTHIGPGAIGAAFFVKEK